MTKESEESQKQAPKKSKLMLIVVIVVLLVLLGGGAFVYMTVIKKPATEVEDTAVADVGQETNGKGEQGVMYDLPPFIVNLSDPAGTRYLKVGISVEISAKNPKTSAEMDQRLPKIKDTIITILSSKTLEEIQTPQGKVSLKQELLRRVNAILTTGKLLDIYLTDFVVQ